MIRVVVCLSLFLVLSSTAWAVRLTVVVQGTGSGTVLSELGIGECRTTCSTDDLAVGSKVAMGVLPDDASTFDGWGTQCDDPSIGGSNSACVFTVNADRTVYVSFSGTRHTTARLTVIKQGDGSATVYDAWGNINCGTTCVYDYTPGAYVTLLFALDSGSTWVGGSWSGCTSVSGDTNNLCDVVMTGDRTVYVSFSKSAGYTLNFAKPSGGTVTSDPPGINCGSGGNACSGVFPTLSWVTLYAAPDSGNVFKSWTGTCATGDPANQTTNPCMLYLGNGTGVLDVGVNFGAPTGPTVTVLKSGTGTGKVQTLGLGGINCGTVCTSEVASGASVVLQATADADSVFTGWSGGGCAGTSFCSLTVNSSTTVTATFGTKPKLRLTRIGLGTGTITSNPAGLSCGPTCTGVFTANSYVALTAVPALGSKFVKWGGACAAAGTNLTCSALVGAANTTTDVSAEFTSGPMTLTVVNNTTTGQTGTVTVNPGGAVCAAGKTCAYTFATGTKVSLVPNGGTGMVFADWWDSVGQPGCNAQGATTCNVTMYGDYQVTANFLNTAANKFSIVMAGTGKGTVYSNLGGIGCGSGGSCSMIYGTATSVTLTATPSAGSTFGGFSGGCTSATTTCTFSVSGAKTVTVTFNDSATSYPVTIGKYGEGNGTVTTQPGGLMCGPTCTASYPLGSLITLKAQPDAGSVFVGFTACPAIGDCVLTPKGAVTVGARFEMATTNYALTVSKSGDGTGTVTSSPARIDCGATCTANFNVATQVTLNVTPSANSIFDHWTGGDGSCTTQTTCVVPMLAASTMYAWFKAKPVATVSNVGTGTGRVTSSPAGIDCGTACQAYFEFGSNVTFTARADAGSVFTGWNPGCTAVDPNCTIAMNWSTTLAAHFELLRTLTVTKSGAGTGKVTSAPAGIDCGATCSASYANNTLVTLTATPDSPSSTFAGWQGCTSTTNSCTVTMDVAKTVTAIFDPAQYKLTVTFAGSGKGTAISDPPGMNCAGTGPGQACSANFAYGTIVTILGVPDSGYYLQAIAGASGISNCNGMDPCTFTVSGNANAAIYFETKTAYTMQVAVDGTGTGSVAGVTSSQVITCGTICGYAGSAASNITLTPTAGTSSVFQGWQDGSCTSNPCVTQLGADRVETAIFTNASAPAPSLVVGKGGFGQGTVTSSPAGINCGSTCTASFAPGTLITLTPSAAAGSTFTGWGGICASAGTGNCTIRLWSLRNVTAYFSDPGVAAHQLTITKDANIVVASDVAGISCGVSSNACTATFAAGQKVKLTATVPSGYVLNGWTGPGACVNVGAGTSCTVTMSSDYTVGVRKLVTSTYTQAIVLAGTGTGSVSSTAVPTLVCPATNCAYSAYSWIGGVLSATANPGSTFRGWSGAGCSGMGTCSPTGSTGILTITAAFEGAGQTLTVTKSGTGSGVVSSSPSGINCGTVCSAIFANSTVVTLTAAPDPGSVFNGWSGACSGTAPCTVTTDQAVDVSASFTQLPPQTLTVTRTGTGNGSVTSPQFIINCSPICSASFPAGQLVTLTASATAGSTFTGWSGGCIGTNPVCAVQMVTAINVTAQFDLLPLSALTVTKTGSGSGTVTSTPGGIDCGSTCNGTFAAASTVTLTAVAAPDSIFSNWGGDCVGAGSCAVTMNGAKAVTATFFAKRTLTVTKAGAGSGTVTSSPGGINCGATCSAGFTDGATVYLTPAASGGYVFTGWGGACSGTATPCAVSMTQDQAVTATFETPQNVPLTIKLAGGGLGSVTSAPAGIDCGTSCTTNFLQGTTVTLTPNIAFGSGFMGWTGGGCSGTICTLTLNAATTVTATFEPRSTYLLSVTKDSYAPVVSNPAGIINCGGSLVTCSANLNPGTVLTLIPQPWSQVLFNRWIGTPACVNVGAANCVLTMDSNYSVTANYVTKYSSILSVSMAGAGKGTVSGGTYIDCPNSICTWSGGSAATITLTATGTNGSVFKGWSGGGCSGTSTCTVTVNNSTANVVATFDPNPSMFTLNVSRAGNAGGLVAGAPGTIYCGDACSAQYSLNSKVTLWARVSSPGTKFVGWSGGGCSGTGPCTVTMDATKTVTATFGYSVEPRHRRPLRVPPGAGSAMAQPTDGTATQQTGSAAAVTYSTEKRHRAKRPVQRAAQTPAGAAKNEPSGNEANAVSGKRDSRNKTRDTRNPQVQ